MTDEQYVKRLGQLYGEVMSLRNDDDYVINQPQMEKLIDVLNFFLDIAKKSDGEVEPVKLVPKEEHSGVTATFVMFDIYGDYIQKFCDAIIKTSAMSIDIANDKVCISVTVPDVFVPIKR